MSVRSLLLASQRLPLAPAQRAALKDLLYTRFPHWFESTPSYWHWLRLRGESVGDDSPERPAPAAPTARAWEELTAKGGAVARASAPAVVVPVHGAPEATLACLYSVLTASPRADLVVIDDASPEPELQGQLASLADRGLFELIVNKRNRGFAATANRGIAARSGRDVVLLNSDTEVFPGWLERLTAAAHSHDEVASVTPLSNDAEIFSYPEASRANRAELEIPPSTLDALAAEQNAGVRVGVPTGVGFCMFLRASALARVGGLDERAYGSGYGEETDWCLRAEALGFRHLAATDVYVWHQGAGSFGARRDALRKLATRRIDMRYPRYANALRDFSDRDPLAPARRSLDAARLGRAAPHEQARATLLFVSHDWGGGTERHAQELARGLEAEGVNVFWLRPGFAGQRVVLEREGHLETPNLRALHRERDFAELVDLLRTLGIDHVHVHHLAGFGEDGPVWLLRLVHALKVSFDFTLHDYTAVCPRFHLVGDEGRYCGEPAVEACQRCMETRGSTFGTPLVWAWRARYGGLLACARRVFCPSDDTRERVQRYFPEVALVTRSPSLLGGDGLPAATREVKRGETHVLATVGALTPEKGFELLIRCATDAAARSLTLRFEQIGVSADDGALARAGVAVTGPLSERAMRSAIEASRASHALFLSQIPETWSYTLSDVLEQGLVPIAFDLGALAERIRHAGRGTLLPVELATGTSVKALNDALIECLEAPANESAPSAEAEPNAPAEPRAPRSLVSGYYEEFSAAAASSAVPSLR